MLLIGASTFDTATPDGTFSRITLWSWIKGECIRVASRGARHQRVLFVIHEHVKNVLCGKAVREELFLVLYSPAHDVICKADVESPRFVRHDVTPRFTSSTV